MAPDEVCRFNNNNVLSLPKGLSKARLMDILNVFKTIDFLLQKSAGYKRRQGTVRKKKSSSKLSSIYMENFCFLEVICHVY